MRNWKCVKIVLIELESNRATVQNIADLIFNGNCGEASNYLEMLEEAKLARKDTNIYARSRNEEFMYRLTWAGYELLDIVRSDVVWCEVEKISNARDIPITNKLISSVLNKMLEN